MDCPSSIRLDQPLPTEYPSLNAQSSDMYVPGARAGPSEDAGDCVTVGNVDGVLSEEAVALGVGVASGDGNAVGRVGVANWADVLGENALVGVEVPAQPAMTTATIAASTACRLKLGCEPLSTWWGSRAMCFTPRLSIGAL